MDPLTFTVIATAVAGFFLIVFSYFRYMRTKDILWLAILIVGVLFVACSFSAFRQKQAIDRKLAAERVAQ